MDRERAETHLRLIAEAELRRVTRRVDLVGEALRAVGALDLGTFDQIRHDLNLSLGVRAPDARMHLVSLMHHPPPRSASGRRTTPRFTAAAPRVVSLGQVIQLGEHGELRLLAFVRAAQSARFVVVRTADATARPPLRNSTAVDDQGHGYLVSSRGWTRTDRTDSEGALDLRPNPPHEIRWLDLSLVPGAPPVRVALDAKNLPPVTVTRTATSPGEILLTGIAAGILARAHSADGLGDIIAALQVAGALAPHSPVPGQLARLCATLGVEGHGIAAPPADALPEPWQDMLTNEPRAPSQAEGWAVAAVQLPELDGARLTLLGLRRGAQGTIAHLQASGVELEDDWLYIRGVRPLPVLWIRDDGGRWHTPRSAGLMPQHDYGAVMLRMQIVPPLDPGTRSIDVLATASSAQARVTLPLRWR